MRYYIINADGDPQPVASLETWGEWFQANKDARVVAKTRVGDAEVSTVFLAIDHSFGGSVPILFETLIFGGDHDGWMERYATKAHAQAGHLAVVEALQAGRSPDADEPLPPGGNCGESVPQAGYDTPNEFVPPNAGSTS